MKKIEIDTPTILEAFHKKYPDKRIFISEDGEAFVELNGEYIKVGQLTLKGLEKFKKLK